MHRLDRLLASALFLLGLSGWFVGSSASPSPESAKRAISNNIQSRHPTLDRELLRRMELRFGPRVLEVEARHGSAGLLALDEFDEEFLTLAADSAGHVDDLFELLRSPAVVRRLMIGPWRQTTLDLAYSGKLSRFLAAVKQLAPSDLAVADQIPAAVTVHGARERTRVIRGFLRSVRDVVGRHGKTDCATVA